MHFHEQFSIASCAGCFLLTVISSTDHNSLRPQNFQVSQTPFGEGDLDIKGQVSPSDGKDEVLAHSDSSIAIASAASLGSVAGLAHLPAQQADSSAPGDLQAVVSVQGLQHEHH